MKSAKDILEPSAAHYPCYFSGGLRVRPARSLAESREGSVGHERGGGGHLSPRRPSMNQVLSQAPTLKFAPLIFSADKAGAAKQGHGGGFTAFQLLISKGCGGEGKTASSALRT